MKTNHQIRYHAFAKMKAALKINHLRAEKLISRKQLNNRAPS